MVSPRSSKYGYIVWDMSSQEIMHVAKITIATIHRTMCIVLDVDAKFCVDERVGANGVLE